MVKRYCSFFFIANFLLLLLACGPAGEERPILPDGPALFELLPAEKTNINFINRIQEGLNTNVLMYEYFYNGAGVAAGDLNKDGLEDLVFTSNMEDNALYLNMGDLQFREVAGIAGVKGRPGPWKTGITMADVNGDGLLDLYICYSGKMAPEKLINQLFINQGNGNDGIPRFTEQTSEYGLNFPTNTTHAVFFDFDRDGDLDLFLLNHHPDSLPKLNEEDTENVLGIDDQVHGVRLLRNDENHFTDITIEAGIISSPITYGLGAGIVDIDLDGWTDIYICNDFSLPDYLYINNGDGTFTDRLQEKLGHTSYASMGNNVVDVNNDALPDIFSLDMLPEDNRRQKLLLAPNDYDFFELNLRLGFYYQYLRSMLHLNHGNGTFSEIGQIAGIAATDWSWAPVFADYDNDGWKDLLITNGYLRDYTNMDFLRSMDMFVKRNRQFKRTDVLELVQQMPETELYNYMFRNNGNTTFTRVNTIWGLTEGSYSNGAVYVDLDNDGDLEIVTNNINKTAFLYENKTNEVSGNHFLKIRLSGNAKNRYGHGAKVFLYVEGQQQMWEQQPARGYQSSVSPILHFGIGTSEKIDSVKVVWLGGLSETRYGVTADQTLDFLEEDAQVPYTPVPNPIPSFKEVHSPITYQHQQPAINDFRRQPLMLNAKSYEGPCMATADVNMDGREDIFIGGGKEQAGGLFLGYEEGFRRQSVPDFDRDKMSDDVDAVFFDADNDDDADLYVCSGGYHDYDQRDEALQDRLYINDGEGNFLRAEKNLPAMLTSSSCARINDVDGDGDLDVFTGGFVVPGRYPETPESRILLNDGKGIFKDHTASVAEGVNKVGMVTDAAWIDLDEDGSAELVVVGLWMPVKVFSREEGRFKDHTERFFDQPRSGFWNTLLADDFNKDGRMDLVVGNLGLNAQIQASPEEPADLYYGDFDNNGIIDPIICFYILGESYPYVTRKELIAQLPLMAQKFPTFESYADATIADIISNRELETAGHLQVNLARSTYFENTATGKFEERHLPLEAQYAPVYTINSLDYNHDGNQDLLLCGNINQARIRFGKYDANYGLLLEGNGKGGFKTISQIESGFKLKGDVRSALVIGDQLIFGINSKEIVSYQLTQ